MITIFVIWEKESVYIDDLFIIGPDDTKITWLKNQLRKEFDISYLGPIKTYLGKEFNKIPSRYFLPQNKYTLNMITEFGMQNSRYEYVPLPPGLILFSDMGSPPVNTQGYCRMVGKFIFLTTTRPDIAYAVSVVSCFMAKPQQTHLEAVKRILRDVKFTLHYSLHY